MILQLQADLQDVEGCYAEAGNEACDCAGEDDLDVRALDGVSLSAQFFRLLCTSSRRGAAAEDIHLSPCAAGRGSGCYIRVVRIKVSDDVARNLSSQRAGFT